MTFRGWPVEALEFYEGLEADNTKSYWLRNKAVYDEKVLAPMQELAAELGPAWGETKIFRPYRDIRFSADKTPYKTSIAAVVGDAYIQLTVGDAMLCAHCYQDRLGVTKRAAGRKGGERAMPKAAPVHPRPT